MALYYITESNWNSFLHLLITKFTAYSLENREGKLFWTQVSADKMPGITINRYRALHSIKNFFFPLAEEVTHEPSPKKTVLIGVKACDLKQLEIMDALFSGGVVADPYYVARRQNTIIISCDCDASLPSCFCTKISGQPYPKKGFDINLSLVRAGYIVETGSSACDDLIMSKKRLFQVPQSYHLAERDHIRQKITKAVTDNNQSFSWNDPRTLVQSSHESPQWLTDIAGTCVECDACRFNCGTCYCFFLGNSENNGEKMRTWDSCQSTGYGRVAGGANPRKEKHERLRNYYACKLVYRPENFDVYACSGCGRCIEVCPGKIDIRKSLQKLYEHVQKPV
ncbi:MAG: 4Fe-4S dicluster domain-containing protein [Elusimicrobia bacterium]|nr:4Fe-4S dicluster domain-containing protein [Elusimicrobiota bacterium]